MRCKTVVIVSAVLILSFVIYSRCLALTWSGKTSDSANFYLNSSSVMAGYENWSLEFELMDTIFVPYQPIWARITVTNIGSVMDTVPLLAAGDGYHRLHVIDGNNNEMPQYKIHISGDFGSWRYAYLSPGEEFTVYWDLLANLTFPLSQEYLPNLKPGNYRVQLEWNTVPTIPPHCDPPTMTTPPLSFRVIEPTGDMADAYSLYIEAHSCMPEDPYLAGEKLKEISTRFPYTPYDERSLRCLSGLASRLIPGDYTSARIEFRKQYFLRFPHVPTGFIGNHGSLVNSISKNEFRELCRRVAGKPGASRSLERIKKRYPWVFEESDK